MLEGSVEMARAAASPHRGDLKGQSFSQTAHGVPGTVEVLEAAPQFPWEGQRRRALVDSWGGRSSPSCPDCGDTGSEPASAQTGLAWPWHIAWEALGSCRCWYHTDRSAGGACGPLAEAPGL